MVADDAQWLDRPTQDALVFVARRVGGDPVAVIATVRAGQAGSFVGAGLAWLGEQGP